MRVRTVVVVAVCGIVLVACQSDSVYEDLALDESHFGMRAQVEPDEPFSIDLFGNGAYPDIEWMVVDSNAAQVRLDDVEIVPARPKGAWYGEYEGPFLPVNIHRFRAVSVGESLLALEVRIDGLTVDRYEVTVSVVEDACDLPEDGEIIAANRC